MSRERDLERIKSLVALAGDPRTPRHEAEVAAVQACRRLHADKLLEGLIDGSGSNQAQHEQRARAQAIRVNGPLLVLGEGPMSWRLALLHPGWRATGTQHIGSIPKRLVIQIVWASDELKKKLEAKGRVIDYVLVDRTFVDGV